MTLKKNLDEMTEEEIDARIAELQGTGGSGAEENTPAPKPVDEMTEDEVDARIAELQAGQSVAEKGETVELSAPQRRQPEVVRRDVNGLSDEEYWRKGNLSTGEYVSLKTKMAGLEPFEVTDEMGNAEGMAKTVGNLAVNALARPFANFRQMRQQQLMRGFEDDGAGGQRKVAEMSDAEQDFLADEAGMNGWRGAARHLLGNLFGNVSRPKVGKDGKLTMEWERTNEPTVGKKAVRWLFSSDDEDTPLKMWDRMEGVKYADDAERRAARAKYLQDLAGGMVEMDEVKKENARREFKGRNPTEDVDMLGELVVQGAYTLPFAVDRTGLLAGAISAASRYGELKSDKYAFDKDGNMVVDERRDTNDLGAATKATLGAAAEVGVEKVGGELATGAASKLLKATIGRIPLVSETAGKLAATEAGQAVSQFLRRYRVLASRTGFNSLPAEIVEEFEQDLIDKGLGIGERESAKEGTDIASRAAEATAEFWDPKNLWNLTKSMVGLMVVQGGAAHAADRLGSRRIDAVLEKGLGLDENTVRSYTKGEKQVAFEAWLNGMDEQEIATTFKDGAKYINRLVKEIGDTAGKSDFGTASEVKFTVPTNGDGNALWNRATDEYGRSCLRIADEKAGVTVDEYELHDGSTVYRVYDKAGNRMSADSKDAALAAADKLATKSALRDAKIEFIEGMKGRMFDGVNVFYGDTIKDVMQGIREEYGEDALKSLTDGKEFQKGAATGQAFHFQNDAGEDCVAFVLDNIRNAEDAMFAVNHEVLGHTGIGAAVEDKGAFLAKMDAAGLDPADRRNFEDEVAQQMRERGLATREDVFKDPQAAEELFAYVAENIRRGGNASLKNKFVAAVRAVVREKFGRDLKFNGDDIYAMIDRGRAKIEQGTGGKSVTGKAGVQQDADTDFALVRSDDQLAAQDKEAARQRREAEAERLQHEANALRVMDEDQARDAALEKAGGPQEVADYRLYYQQERLHADLVADSFPELFADFCETRHMRVDDPQSRVFFYRAVLEGQKMRQTDAVTIEQTMRGETGEEAKPVPEPAKQTPTPAPQPAAKPAKPAEGATKGSAVGGSVDELRQILEKTEIGRAILTNYETAVADDPAFAEAQFQRSVKANAEDLGLGTHENGPVSAPRAEGTTSRPEGAESGKAASTPQSGDSGKTNVAEGLEVTELKPITAKSASHNFDRVKRNLIGALRGLATARGKDGAAKAEAAFKKALADFTAAPSSLWRFRVRDTATGDVFKFDLDARIDRKTQTLNREQVAGLVSRAAPGVSFKVAKKVANRLCDELDPLVPGHVAASYAAKVNNPKGYERNFTRRVDAYVEANPDSLLASFVGQFGNRVTPKMLAQVFAQDATVDADLLAEQDAEAGRRTWDAELENWAEASGRFGPRREDGSYDFSGVYEQLVKELAEANADTRTVEERRADAEREEAERAEFKEARERAAEEEAYDFEGEAEVRQAYDDLLAEATVRDQRDNPVGSLADIPDGEMFSLGEDEYEMVEHLDGGAVVMEEFRDFDDIRRYVVTPREGGVDVKEVTDGGRDGEAGGAGVRGSQDREGNRRQSDADLEGRGGVPRGWTDRAAEESGAAGRAAGGAASRAADSVGGQKAEGGTLKLASASAEEIAAEEARNHRRRIIGMRQAAPIRGGGTPWQETELGSQGAGGQMELQFRRVAEKHGVSERAVRRAGPGILALDKLADANEAEAEEAGVKVMPSAQFRRAAANNADTKNGNAFRPSWRIGRLYTGSAADYEKPSLHHVGTGEGSQVYGWGLYASDRRGVAESYAKIANENNRGAKALVRDALKLSKGDVDGALRILIKNKEKSFTELGKEVCQDAIDLLKAGSYDNNPYIYEQTFFTNRAPGDESHLLKWYEPVSEEQTEWILDALKDMGSNESLLGFVNGERKKDLDLDGLTWRDVEGEDAAPDYYPDDVLRDYLEQYLDLAATGGEVYGQLSEALGSPQAASEFLARADIDGIKYPVDSYGGKTIKDGDKAGWNYVSFRDDNITVDHKWVDGELQFRQPRSRVTPAEDAAYMDAVKRGDMETAARMVREAAAKAMPDTKVVGDDGLPMVVYHSVGHWYVQNGRADFNVFDGSIAKDGFMFRGSEEWIGPDGWGARNANGKGRFIKVFLNIRNPLIVDAKGANYTRIPNPMMDDRIGYPESVVREAVDENERQRKSLQRDIDVNDPKWQNLLHSWEYFTRVNGKYILPDGLIHVTNELSDENGERFDGVIVRNVDEGEKDGVGDDYITQDPYAIKLADPVTYDDNGEVIPLSRRFNADNADIRFRQPRSRVTQAEDAAYMKAVESGDTATAARMIREAAEKAMPNVLKGEDGLPLEVYRGGLASGVNKYVFPRRPQYRASWIEGTFLTDNKQIAEAFARGDTVLSLFAEIKKPLVIDAKGSGYTSIPVPGDAPKWLKEKYSLDNELDADSITKNAFDHGYDGVVIKNVVEGVGGPSATDIIVRDPLQIKSADPVTRNDAGEVIPLSQRFSKSPDIRFRQPRFRDNPEARALSDALGLSPSELAALGFSASRNFDEGREERADRAARTRNAAELDLVRNHGRILSPGGMKAAMTSLREWTQDYLIRLRNLEEQLGVGRDLSSYHAADRAYGLVTDKAARFQKEMVEPLMRELEAAGVTDPEGFADFGQYLIARHGREYNEMIAQRSPLVAQALGDRRTKALAQDIIAGIADLDDANIANFQTLLGWSDAETARFRRDVSGSSKSTAYWARLLDQYRADGRAAKYAAAERIVRDMTKAVREELVATGRLSRAQADAWERLSPNYVPMMHDEEEDIDLWSRFFWSAEGAGESRRGGSAYRKEEVHHAFGRTTMPDNPVPFVVQMYQSAIQRGADNLVRKALADIVRAQEAKLATDPDAPQIGRVFRYMGEEERKEAQKKVGSLQAAVAAGTATPAQQAELARLRTALAESANAGAAIPFTEVVGANGMTYRIPKVSSVEAENPDIVAFKEDGELKFVKLGIADSQKQVEKGWLASSDAAAIGAALKKQTLVHHWLIDGLRRVTATFSALRTAWSPTFLVSNWTADNAQAARNLYATFGAAGAAKFEHFVFARNSFGAARAVLNDRYGTSLIQRYAKEWAENGGRIGGMATENFADIQRKFDRQLRAMTSQFRHLAGIRSMADAMTYVGDRMNGLKEFSEHWNSVVEMSTRIAAYATYREMTKGNGKSDAENIADAVSYSRDITVNFNRKGRLTPLLNAWWAFSNASIQDLQRSFQAFGERRYGAAVGGVAGLAARTGLKMGAGMFILGFLSSMLGFGQDDPEEEKEGKAQWKDTKEYVKQNKMAFRIGDRTFSIPVRGLSRLPYYLGHVAYEMFTGRRSAAKAASDVVGLAGDNLTDVMGSTDSWTQWFLPSVIRPGSEIVRNRTFTGSTMYRESRTAYDVKSNMGRTNTSPAWHTVAKLLNRLGGGENRGAFGGKSDRGSDLPLVGRAFDQQPEKLEAVWNWLGGSAMKDLGQIAGTVKDVFGFLAGQGWNRKVRNVPFVSRVMANLDENSARFHEAENAYRKARAEAESFDPDATEEIERFVQDHPWAARENRRWGQELKDLSNMASNLMSQEMKAGSDEEREAIHKMRLGVQYLFLHRLETDPRTDGPEELRFERERSRAADRALKAAKREQKRAQKREQRERWRMFLK